MSYTIGGAARLFLTTASTRADINLDLRIESGSLRRNSDRPGRKQYVLVAVRKNQLQFTFEQGFIRWCRQWFGAINGFFNRRTINLVAASTGSKRYIQYYPAWTLQNVSDTGCHCIVTFRSAPVSPYFCSNCEDISLSQAIHASFGFFGFQCRL